MSRHWRWKLPGACIEGCPRWRGARGRGLGEARGGAAARAGRRPYTAYFAIRIGVLFIVVTLLAHLVFGAVLGLWARCLESRWLPATE